MPLFTTAFTPPDAPTGLTATAIGGAAVLLDWDDTGLSEADFIAYHVRRSLTGGDDYVELATITDSTASGFADYSAPLDRTIFYQVTQSNLDYESEPAEVETALEGCSWWIVTPGAEESSFELPNVTAYQSEWPLPAVEHAPIGRPRKLVESGLLLGEEGTLTAHLLAEHDPATLELLRAASGSPSEVLLKTPYGEVVAVSLGTIQRTRSGDGRQDVSFRFVAV